MVRAADVLIVGGGPAGCAAARLLALWGHTVRLVTRPRSRQASTLAESLPPSCGKLFRVLGVAEAVDRAGFIRSTGNTVWWGSGDARCEPFPDGERGWQVAAGRLATLLLEQARDAGALVDSGRATADDIASSRVEVVLDCTGRRGVIARSRGWRVYEPTLKSVALVASWSRRGEWPIPDQTHTLVESYSDGWLWSVPTSPGARVVAVMVDPRSSTLAGRAARDIYFAEIAKAPHFASLVANADCDDGVQGFDASMYTAQQFADDRVLLVGDAASFIDPLSSAGVKKALASGWLAAVAAHTALINPPMRGVAFDFFAAREREMYDRLRDLTRQYLSTAADAHPHPFWSDRDFTENASDTGVEAAFARLRAEPQLRVRRGEIVIAERAAVAGCEIVLETRLIWSGTPEGIRHLHDVDVVALVDLAPTYDDVGELFDAYTRRAGPVALHDFLLVLATALARQWLVWM